MAELPIVRKIAEGRSVFHDGTFYSTGQEDALHAVLGADGAGPHLTEGETPVLAGDWTPKAPPPKPTPKT